MVYLPGEKDRIARALLQQVAGADGSDKAPVFRHDAEVPEPAHGHQRVRAIEELRSGDRHQRPRSEAVHRLVQRAGAQGIDGAGDVPLGQDADAGARSGGDEDRADLPFGKVPQGVAKAHPGFHQGRRRRHDVPDAVAEGEAVNAGECGRAGIAHPLGRDDGVPARLGLLVHLRGQRQAGPLRLGQRGDALLRQAGHHGGVNRRGGARIAERAVTVVDPDPEPLRYGVERGVRGAGREQRGQLPDAKGPVRTPGERAAVMFRLEHREVEPDRIADHDTGPDPAGERRQDLVRLSGRTDVLVRDAVDRRRGRGNRHVRIDQPVERLAGIDGAAGQRHGAHLHDPVPAGIEAGGFGVERDRFQGRQRNGAQSGVFLSSSHGRTLLSRSRARYRAGVQRPSVRRGATQTVTPAGNAG